MRRRPTTKSPVSAGDLLPGAMKDLGVVSERVTARVRQAWERVADPAWGGAAVPSRLVGGVLVVEVGSASLRDEISQFHRERLLEVLRASLPDVPLVAIRFVAGPSSGRPS